MPRSRRVRASSPVSELPSSVDLAGHERRVDQPGDRFDQLALAVAFDAGDADDLAGAHVERHVVDDAARAGADGEIADAQRDRARLRRRLLDPQQHVAPDHQPRQLGRARLPGLDAADDLAVAHDRHVIGDREHFASLCVMMTIVLPCSRIPRRIAKNSSTSCGVSTAVGSSRISSWALR